MNFNHSPNRVLRVRPALRRSHQQALGQRLEVEPAIEAVGEGGKILRCVFSKAKTVETATETGFEVAQHSVNLTGQMQQKVEVGGLNASQAAQATRVNQVEHTARTADQTLLTQVAQHA